MGAPMNATKVTMETLAWVDGMDQEEQIRALIRAEAWAFCALFSAKSMADLEMWRSVVNQIKGARIAVRILLGSHQ